ncbi:AAA family ATPase, partial [Fusobacterium polymorphum]
KIFNTQIYKEMYDGFLKEATDKYTKQIDYLSKDINSLKDNMEDKEEISNFLKEEETLKESLNTKFSKTTEISTKLSNEIKDYETDEINLKNLISNIEDEENKIE